MTGFQRLFRRIAIYETVDALLSLLEGASFIAEMQIRI